MNICLKKILATALLLLPALAFSAPVAYVHEMHGLVSAAAEKSSTRLLKIGDTLEEGQTVVAGKDSTATLRFADGQLVLLHPDTTFGISKYRYNDKDVKSSSIFFRLAVGALRFVSGVVGASNPKSFGIQTPTATIGIRGTDGVVITDGESTSASSNSGIVILNTPGGHVDLHAGHYSSAHRDQAPSAPFRETQAPSTDRSMIARLMHAVVPRNTPIDINSSANAARAARDAQEAARRTAADATAENRRAAREAEARAAAAAAAAEAAAAAAGDAATSGGGLPPAPPATDANTDPNPNPNPNPNPDAPTAPTTSSFSTTSGGSGGGGTGTAPASAQ